jgi:hypothetical protein
MFHRAAVQGILVQRVDFFAILHEKDIPRSHARCPLKSGGVGVARRIAA